MNPRTVKRTLDAYQSLKNDVLYRVIMDSFMFYGESNPDISAIYYQDGGETLNVEYFVYKRGREGKKTLKISSDDLDREKFRAEKLSRIRKYAAGSTSHAFLSAVQPKQFYIKVSQAVDIILTERPDIAPDKFQSLVGVDINFRLVALKSHQTQYKGNVFDAKEGDQVLDCLFTGYESSDFSLSRPKQARVYIPIGFLTLTEREMKESMEKVLFDF